jgi:aspartate racemase
MRRGVKNHPLHVGIVACSAEGAALCYRTLCHEAAAILGRHAHPEVSMHTHSLARYVEHLDRDDMEGVAALMLDSAGKLARAGADFLVCPDNTCHQAMDLVLPRSPLPWLHIAEVVADEANRRGFRRAGVMGTRWLTESQVYPDKLGARSVGYAIPGRDARAEVSRIIMEELVMGDFRPASVGYLVSVIEALEREGCDAVVLGCTELPLVIGDRNSPLPALDSTRLLARSALQCAVSAVPPRR